MVLGSFSMLEFMCISHNKEAKKEFPCLNKIHQETQKMCDAKCQSYKQAIKKWESLRMTPEIVHDKFDELAQIFSKSCRYLMQQHDFL
uniref:Uncharacterized protein n=1 Tax=Romanomermis culicivorax TaxID=13658 RepID=A0A915I957_ROMCU